MYFKAIIIYQYCQTMLTYKKLMHLITWQHYFGFSALKVTWPDDKIKKERFFFFKGISLLAHTHKKKMARWLRYIQLNKLHEGINEYIFNHYIVKHVNPTFQVVFKQINHIQA